MNRIRNLVPKISFVLAFATLSSASFAYNFGDSGYSGRDGYDGRDGQSGQSVTYFANGQNQYLNLAGTDGSAGSVGYAGEDARYCNPPYHPEYDLWGADGGNGGRGGRGGDGGDGGDATIYFTDASQLSKILIDSTPGRANYGSQGGSGGDGCRCYEYRWTVQKCHDQTNPDGSHQTVCEDHSYSCWDGSHGSSGSSGRNGTDGHYGSLTLINSPSVLPADIRSERVRVGDLLGVRPVLAENLWEQRGGARNILAPGSRVTDTYSYYTGRRFYPVTFGWNARRGIQEFADRSLQLSLSNYQISTTVDAAMWASIRKSISGDTTTFTVEKAINATDATQLSTDIRGTDSNVTLYLKDAAAVSDLVNTSINMKLEADTLFNKNLFVGVVPANVITVNADEIQVHLGQLPNIDPKYLKSGKGLILKMTVTRSLADRSANQDFKFKHKIQ